MKFIVILLALTTQTSASFFSELSISMSYVGSSVGKLVSDVAGDMKDTFDCTYLAVRQVFTNDTTVPDYYQKCETKKTEEVIPLPSPGPIQIYIGSLESSPFEYGSTQPANREQKSLESLSIGNEKDVSDKGKVENVLPNETHMSAELEHKFEGLSKHIDEDFAKIENDQMQRSMEKMMQEIAKLHREEEAHKNKIQQEIQEIFDKVLTKLENNKTNILDLKSEIKSAFAEIEQNNNNTDVEQELTKWKKEELKSINDLKEILIEDQQNDKLNENETLEADEIEKRGLDLKSEIKSAFAEIVQNNNNSDVEQELTKWKKEELKSINDLKEILIEDQQNDKLNENETLEADEIEKRGLDLKSEIKSAFAKIVQTNNNSDVELELTQWKEEELKNIKDIKEILMEEKENDDSNETVDMNDSETEMRGLDFKREINTDFADIENKNNKTDVEQELRKSKEDELKSINDLKEIIMEEQKNDKSNETFTMKANETLKSEIKSAFAELEQNNNTDVDLELTKWKQEELKSIKDLKEILMEEKQKDKMNENLTLKANKTEKRGSDLKREIKSDFAEIEQNNNNTDVEQELRKLKEDELKSINDSMEIFMEEQKNDKSNETFTMEVNVTMKSEIKSAFAELEQNNNTDVDLELTKWKQEELKSIKDLKEILMEEKQKDEMNENVTLKANETEKRGLDLKREIKSDFADLEKNNNNTDVEQELRKLKEDELKSINKSKEIFMEEQKNDKSNETFTMEANETVKSEIKSAFAELEQNNNNTDVDHELTKWKQEELKSIKDLKEVMMEEKQKDKMNENVTLKANETENRGLYLKREFKSDFAEIENKNNKTDAEQELRELKEDELKSINDSTEIFMEDQKKYKSNETFIMKANETMKRDLDLKSEIKSALAEIEQNNNKTDVEQELRKWKEEELKSIKDLRETLMEEKQKDKMNENVKLKANETEKRGLDLKREIKSAFAEIEQKNNKIVVEQELRKWKEEELKSIKDLKEIWMEEKQNDKSNKTLTMKANETEKRDLDLKTEIKSAIDVMEQNNNKTDVEKELRKWKKEELKSINELKEILIGKKRNDKSNEMVSMKTSETTINPTTTTKNLLSTEPSTEKPIVVVTTLKPQQTTKEKPKTSNDLDYLVSRDKQALYETKTLMSYSRKRASIMNSVLKDLKSATNLFENPELLGR